MSVKETFRESRRSTRVPLRIAISFESEGTELRTEGETIVVNLHGALVSTALPLRLGLEVSIHVYLTDKNAQARVVYVDPENGQRCGIELDHPRNIWGVPLPPTDWDETAGFEAQR